MSNINDAEMMRQTEVDKSQNVRRYSTKSAMAMMMMMEMEKVPDGKWYSPRASHMQASHMGTTKNDDALASYNYRKINTALNLNHVNNQTTYFHVLISTYRNRD
jgi:maltodextrin utilization protein YvdJ